MHRISSILLFLFVVFASNANMLVNGDLETWDSGSTFPEGWGTSTLLTNAQIVKITSGAFSGTTALQAQYTSTSSHSRFNSPNFKVEPGTRYKLTYFTRGSAVLRWVVMSPTGLAPRAPVDGEPHLPASDYQSSGNKLQSTNWVKRECFFDVPADITATDYCLHFSINSTVAPHHFSIDKVSLSAVQPDDGSPWQSELVSMDETGKLTYTPDDMGYSIPDFSAAGYRGGGVALPDMPVVKTISAIAGDNTAHIQAALDEVGNLPLVNGIRGALLLKAGLYPVSGILYVNKAGVVLRGEGEGNSVANSTIIFATGNTPSQRTVIYLGNRTSPNEWSSKLTSNLPVQDDYLPAGTNRVRISSANSLSIGDQVVIRHDMTQPWLDAIEGGVGASGDAPWTLSDNHFIPYNRYIKAIDRATHTITLDAPLFYGFRKSLSPAYVYKMSNTNIVKEVGIENLRVRTEYNSSVKTTASPYGTYISDENHAMNGVEFVSVENGWANNVTLEYFGGMGFLINRTTRSTIKDCSVIDPISVIEGGKRYAFNTHSFAQLNLFENCYAHKSRHGYISNGTSTASGNVFLRCKSDLAYAASEGHRRWSSGYLFDNYKEIAYNGTVTSTLAFHNRGTYGTSHGWGLVTGVAWNCDLTAGSPTKGHLIVQQPPTGQNFAIGTRAAKVDGNGPFPGPTGYIEGTNRKGPLQPESLYEAQLNQRLITSVPALYQPTSNPISSVLKIYNDGTIDIAARIQSHFGEHLLNQHASIVIYNALGQKLAQFTYSQLSTSNTAINLPKYQTQLIKIIR
ncbi:MAG: hypothetical protein RBT57_01615 [Paludibacter sp.]|jgi:hypothetical protein|nr:hypothetical protein [Paludibacter sp.]